MLEVQLVNPPHDRPLGRRHRPRLVVHAAAAQPQQLRLPPQRQRLSAVDHRFALTPPPPCPTAGNPCPRSIIALRSAAPPCRAHRTKNHSPASAPQSWRATSSRPPPEPPHPPQRHRTPPPRRQPVAPSRP